MNIVSVAGVVAFPPSGPYSASKHAARVLARDLRAALRTRIHGLTVMPGFIETEGFPQKTALQSPFFRRMIKTPEELADRIVHAIERRRLELTYPRFYRTFGVAQALRPGPRARFASRSRSGYRSTAS